MKLLLAAILYAMFFWVVTWRRPWLALASIFALAPFQNDLSMGGPIRFSIAEVNLLLTLPIFLAERRPARLGPLAFPVIAYLFFCLFSSALHWRDTALVSLVQIAVYLVAAVAVFRSLPLQITEYRAALSTLIAVCCLLAVIVLVKQSGYVLGLHKNGSGSSLACGLIVCAELWFGERDTIRKQRLLAALVLIAAGLFFTLSRGAWITAATGLIVILLLHRRFLLLLRATFVLAALVAVCWGRLPAEARNYATAFDRDHYNIQARFESIDYALYEFRKSPLTGVGVGLRKEYDATNIFLLTLAETGVPGLLAFAAIHIAFLRMAYRSRRYLPRSSPEATLVALGTALVIGKIMHGAVDLYWGRGDLMITWAAAGMAIRACAVGRRRAKRPAPPRRTPALVS
ncbi:MAG: O-antigen ligase family protein [Chthoniobacteraceae bacterium]|nr:O-antigen ligase family protein [Chthoniobacteraceae bacterium]